MALGNYTGRIIVGAFALTCAFGMYEQLSSNSTSRRLGNYTVREFKTATEVRKPNLYFGHTSWVDTNNDGVFDVRIEVAGIGRMTDASRSPVSPTEQKTLEHVLKMAR